MMEQSFSVQKIINLFGLDITRDTLIKAENTGLVPKAERHGNNRRKWNIEDIPKIGSKYGFMKKPKTPLALAVFTTKGGVLKSTLSLNLGRLAALHDIKTCIVGLDMQCDITNALGFEDESENAESLEDALSKIESVYGLPDFFDSRVTLSDITVQTDIPTLFAIPETGELVTLERQIASLNMREFWLRDNVIAKLKESFDLIIMDCAPNWNLLISNALVACDYLISPLECKINNFRNLRAFRSYLERFKRDTQKSFGHVFVPTKFASTRKLSSEIRSWYMANVPGCISSVIRESAPCEEAMASNLSLPEYSPKSLVADEMRETIFEIWSRVNSQNTEDSFSRSLESNRRPEIVQATSLE